MKKTIFIGLLVICVVICIEGKKIASRSRSSGSGRGSSKTKYPSPAPTSFSNPQPSAPKPSLFGWQEKPAQPAKSYTSWQSKSSSSGQSHSYPSSQTGLSGSPPKQASPQQENFQRNNAPQNFAGQQSPVRTPTSNNQPGHSYPKSNGLSGSGTQQQGSGIAGSGTGGAAASGQQAQQQHGLTGSAGTNSGYPSQSNGLSGSGAASHGYPTQNSGLSGTATGHSGYPQQQGNSFSGSGVAPPPYPGYNSASYPKNNYGNNYNHPQGPPPPYSGPGYGGYGGHGFNSPAYSPQMPGYFGNYGNYGKGFGGPSRTSSALTGVGIAGAGVGTLLTGLALWNLARSTGNRHHTVIYDNRGQPVAVAPANDTSSSTDTFLADLVNCTLTISNDNATEVLAIPCSIATSFSPDAEVKESALNTTNDNTKCTVTVVTKTGKEYMTTIPCATLLNTAAENNVTEPPLLEQVPEIGNNTQVSSTNGNVTSDLNQASALRLTGDKDVYLNQQNLSLNCTPQPGDVRDPINPCFAVTHDLTVIPLEVTDKPLTPSSA